MLQKQLRPTEVLTLVLIQRCANWRTRRGACAHGGCDVKIHASFEIDMIDVNRLGFYTCCMEISIDILFFHILSLWQKIQVSRGIGTWISDMRLNQCTTRSYPSLKCCNKHRYQMRSTEYPLVSKLRFFIHFLHLHHERVLSKGLTTTIIMVVIVTVYGLLLSPFFGAWNNYLWGFKARVNRIRIDSRSFGNSRWLRAAPVDRHLIMDGAWHSRYPSWDTPIYGDFLCLDTAHSHM